MFYRSYTAAAAGTLTPLIFCIDLAHRYGSPPTAATLPAIPLYSDQVHPAG